MNTLETTLRKEGVWKKIIEKATMRAWSNDVIGSSLRLYVDLRKSMGDDFGYVNYDRLVSEIRKEIVKV